MSTKFLNPGWRMPRNANQSKSTNYSLKGAGGAANIKIPGLANSLNLTDKVSISIWWKTSTFQSNKYIMGFNGPGTANGFDLGMHGSNIISYAAFSGSSSGNPTVNFAYDDGNWHHYVLTYNGSIRKLYIDGILKAESAASGNMLLDSSGDFYIFSTNTGFLSGAGEAVDNCVFDYALSDGGVSVGSTATGQIAQLYGDGLSLPNPMALPSSPIAYYPLGTSAWNGQYLAENNAIGDYVFDFLNNTTNINTGLISKINPVDITYATWFNTSDLGTYKYLSGTTYGASGDRKVYWALQSAAGAAGQVRFFVTSNSGSGDQWSFSAASTYNDGKWHHAVGTWDNTNKVTKLYIDGVDVGTSTNNSNTDTSLGYGDSVFRIGQPVGGTASTAKQSNSQIFNTALSSTEVTTLYNYGSPIQTLASIPQSSNLKAWYKLDASEVYNSTTTEWSIDNNQNPSAYPSSLEFDSASSDYISCGNDSSLNTNALTVSCWVKCDPFTPAVGPAIISKDIQSTNSPERSFGFLFVFGSFLFQNWDSAGNENRVTISNATIPINTDGQWHHLVATIDGTTNANGIKVYIDNVVVGQATATATGIRTSTVPFVIGGSGSTGTDYNWNGQISNVSYWNTALTSAQVTEIYNNGTPSNLSSHSATSNLVSWWKLNNTTTGIEDSKGSNNGTNNGATEYAGFVNTLAGDSSGMSQANLVQSDLQTVAPYSKYAMKLDDATLSDYINVPNNSTLQITGNLTLSSWVRIDGSYVSNGHLIAKADSYVLKSHQGSLSNVPRFQVNDGTFINLEGPSALSLDTWHHITGVREGNSLKLYVNGSLVASSTQTIGNLSVNTNDIQFNAYTSNFSSDITLSNNAIWNVALNASEIREIYNEGLPSNLNTFSGTAPVSWWQLGENSSFDGSNWKYADEMSAGNNADSVNTAETALTNGVGTTANGVSSGMSEGNLVGDAPYSTANAISSNMSVLAKGTDPADIPS